MPHEMAFLDDDVGCRLKWIFWCGSAYCTEKSGIERSVEITGSGKHEPEWAIYTRISSHLVQVCVGRRKEQHEVGAKLMTCRGGSCSRIRSRDISECRACQTVRLLW